MHYIGPMSDESTLSVKPMASSGPAAAPKVQHFQDCDDQALGALVRNFYSEGLSAEALGNVAGQALRGVHPTRRRQLDFLREGCQCASLRASAAATYQGKLRKAAAAKGGQ